MNTDNSIQPLISIVIPNYNTGNYLSSCVDSILSQSYQNFEVIIADGSSTDNSLEVIKDYINKSSAVRSFSEKDNGVYDAMNKGIVNAKGEWLYFIGTDDKFRDDGVLERVMGRIRGFQNEPDIVYGKVTFKYSGDIYGSECTTEHLLFNGNICHQAIFYKKHVFQKVGSFNDKYRILADWDHNLRCFKNNLLDIQFIDEVVAIYNERDGMSSTKYDEVFLRELPLSYLRHSEIEIGKVKRSKEYRVGNALMHPWAFIKRRFSR